MKTRQTGVKRFLLWGAKVFLSLVTLGIMGIAGVLIRLSMGPLSLRPLEGMILSLVQRHDPSIRQLKAALSWRNHRFILHVSEVKAAHYALNQAEVHFSLPGFWSRAPEIRLDHLKLHVNPGGGGVSGGHAISALMTIARLHIADLELSLERQGQVIVLPRLELKLDHTHRPRGICQIRQKQADPSLDVPYIEADYEVQPDQWLAFRCHIPHGVIQQGVIRNPLILKGKGEGRIKLDVSAWTLAFSIWQKSPTQVAFAGGPPFTVHQGAVQGTLQGSTLYLTRGTCYLNKALLGFEGQAAASPHWHGTFQMRLEQGSIPVGDIAALWPKTPGNFSRDWVVAHFKAGDIARCGAKMIWHLPAKGGLEVDHFKGHFALQNVTLTFMEKMPPIYQLAAEAEVDLKGYDFRILSGAFEKQQITGGRIVITPLIGDSFLSLDLYIQGPFQPVFKTLQQAGYCQSVPIFPASLSGNQKTHLHMDFPLIEDLRVAQIKTRFITALSDTAFKIDIPHYPLQVQKGAITLEGTDHDILIKGASLINTLQAVWQWTQDFDSPASGDLTLQGTWTPAQLTKAFSTDLTPYLKGHMQVALRYRPMIKANPLEVRINLDRSFIDLPWIHWKKDIPKPCKMIIQAHKGLKTLSMKTLGALVATGHLAFSPQQEVTSAALTCTTPGPYSLHYTYANQKRALSFKGKVVNLRSVLKPAQDLKPSGNKPQVPYCQASPQRTSQPTLILPDTLHIDAQCRYLILREGITFENVEGSIQGAQRFSTKPWYDLGNIQWTKGNLSALLIPPFKFDRKHPAKKNPFILSIQPLKDHKTQFILTVQDIGATLRALGLTERIRRGALTLMAIQDPTGLYTGDVQVLDMATDAPLLIKVLALASPTLFTELFSHRLSFHQVFCQFRYQHGQLLVDRAMGQGINLGIGGKGKLDFDKQTITFEGVVIPAYLLNTLFSYIPIVGWIFGGEKGVLSTEFTLSGNLQDPRISIRPLSIFKLGFMKALFQRPQPVHVIETRPRD